MQNKRQQAAGTATAAALAAALLAAGGGAQAAVTRFTVDEVRPYGSFNGVEYVQIRATVEGALAPTEAITDIDKAPRDAAGKVAYASKAVLIAPREPERGNGALVLDVPNRGLPIAHAMYNSPHARALMIGSLDTGTGFLESRGFATASIQWELGEGLVPPTFTDATGARRHVEGVGFAAVRDLAVFLRTASRTQGNPLAGGVRQVYGVGYSQTARFLKSFLLSGFNQVEGRQVLDGVHLFAAAAGRLPLNQSGTGPKSVAAATPGFTTTLNLRGVHEEPYTYGGLVQAIQAQGQVAPKIIVANTQTDYYTGRVSLTRTGARSTVDQPQSDSVRIYDIAGAGHLNIRQQNAACTFQHAQLDWTPPLRAMLINLHAWSVGAATPPDSRLMALEARPGDARIIPRAAHMPEATLMVPREDADGNAAEGGVRMPEVAVPLGTNGAANAPNTNSVCRLAGTWQPFAPTLAARKADDTRAPLDTRYPGGLNEYVNRVRTAAEQLVAARLLLPEDAAVQVETAASQALFAPTVVPDIFR